MHWQKFVTPEDNWWRLWPSTRPEVETIDAFAALNTLIIWCENNYPDALKSEYDTSEEMLNDIAPMIDDLSILRNNELKE